LPDSIASAKAIEGYAIRSVSILSFCLAVILFECRITVKVISRLHRNLMIGPIPIVRTAGDPVPDTDFDFGSLLQFPHHYGIDFRRFISIYHTVTGRFSRHSVKWLTPTIWIHNILGAIRQTSGSGSGLIRKSGFRSRITFGWG